MNHLTRLFKKPDRWLCHYKVRAIDSDRVIESCSFVTLNRTREGAIKEAEREIKKWVKYPFEVNVEIFVHEASWLRKVALDVLRDDA